MAFINKTDTQGLQFGLQSGLQPITRKSTDNRNTVIDEKPQSITVPKINTGSQQSGTSVSSLPTQNKPQMQSFLPGYENVNDKIDYKLGDLDKRLNTVKSNMFSIGNPFNAIPGLNKPTIGSDFSKPQGSEQTSFDKMSPEVQQGIQKDIRVNEAAPKSKEDLTQPLLDLGATIQAKPDLTPEDLQNKFPEFGKLDQQVFLDLGATLQANPNLTADEIIEKFPELGIEKKGFLGRLVDNTKGILQQGAKFGEGTVGLLDKLLGTEGLGDIIDYSYKTYGMSPKDLKEKQPDTYNQMMSDMESNKLDLTGIKTTESEDLLNIGQGALTIAQTAAAPGLTAGFTVAGSTNIGGKGLEKVSQVFGGAGKLVNMIPGLSDFRDSLPEEKQAEFDMFVGNIAGSLLLGTRGKANILKNPKQFILDNIGSKQIIDNFKQNVIGVKNTTVDLVKKVAPSKILKKTSEGVDTIDRLIASTNDLDAETVSQFRKNPELMKAIDDGTISKEGLKTELMDIADSADDAKGEAGKAYSELYKSNKTFQPKQILTEMQLNLKDKGAIFDDKGNIVDFDMTNNNIANTPDGEMSLIKSKYNSTKATLERNIKEGKNLSVEEAHTLKRSISNAKYNDGVMSKKSPLLGAIGEGVNKKLKSEVPGWEGVDKLFTERSTKVREISDLIFNRKGDFKGTMKALLGENQYARLQELEKVYPGLTKKLEGIKAYDDYTRTRETMKTGAYGKVMRGAGGASIGAAIGGATFGTVGAFVGGLLGAMITNKITDPALMKAILLRGTKTAGLEAKIGAGIKLTEKEQNMLKTNIDNIVKHNVDIKNQRLLTEQSKLKLKGEQEVLLKPALPEPGLKRIGGHGKPQIFENKIKSNLGTPKNPLVSKGPVAIESKIEGIRRNTQGYKDAPEIGDMTKLGKILDVHNTGGGFPRYQIKIEGYNNFVPMEKIEGGIYNTKGLKKPAVAPREEKSTQTATDQIGKLGDKQTYIADAIAEEIGFKDAKSIEDINVRNRIAEITRMRDADKIIEETNKLKESLLQKKPNGNINMTKKGLGSVDNGLKPIKSKTINEKAPELKATEKGLKLKGGDLETTLDDILKKESKSMEHVTPNNISESELYKYEGGNYRPISYDKALEFGGENVIVDKGQAYLRMKGDIKLNEVKINKLAEELEKKIVTESKTRYINSIQSHTKLGDILDYPALYDEYPQLENLSVGFSKTDSYKGSFNGRSVDVSIIDGVKPEQIKQTLLHEVQHWIQQEHGLQGGGNTDMIRDMDNWNKVYDELLGQAKKMRDMGNKTFKGEPVPADLIKQFETKIKDAKALFNKEMTTKDLMDMKREGIDYMDKIRGDFEEIVGGTDILRNYRKIPGEQGARLAGGDEPLFMGDIEAAMGRNSKGGLQPKQGSIDVKGSGKGLQMNEVRASEEPLIAEARKYKSAEEFVKAKMYEKPKYGMSHRPTFEGSPPAYNLLEGDMLPRDVYSKPERSIASMGMKDPAVRESRAALQKIKGNPNAEITIYRASPKNELNVGDRVSFSKKYAEGEGVAEGSKAFAYKVKAKDIYFAGDDINEFGYFPKDKLKQIREEANNSGLKPKVSEGLKVKGGEKLPYPEYSVIKELKKGADKKISMEEAVNTIITEADQSIHNQWFRNGDKTMKPKLMAEIQANPKLKEAGMRIMYENYLYADGTRGMPMTYEKFLDTPITMYRGGPKGETFTSYSLNKKIAQKFGDVTEIKIKPKETLGSYQDTSEAEVIIPNK